MVQASHLHDLSEVLVRLRSYLRGARYRDRFSASGVNVPMGVRNVVRAVELIAREGEVSVGDVANGMAIEASSASRQVDLAVRHGLVTKEYSAADARRQALSLTDKGESVAREWERQRLGHLEEVLQGWSVEDVATLVRLATRLADDIDALEH